MKNISIVFLLVSAAGVVCCFLLLEELRSHDAYRWLNSVGASIESRDAWNERKWLYAKILLGFLISFAVSLGILIYQKISRRKLKLR
jgi:hypothetical protein